MSKRNTIIAAVLINAALLTLLFVTAASHESEYYAKSHIPSSASEEKPLDMQSMESAKPMEVAVETPQAASSQVPAPVNSVASAAAPVMQEQVVHSLPEVAVENKPIQSASPSTPLPVKHREVVVKKGDSLDKIAKHHKVSLEEIVKLNQLPNSFLKIGQVLKLPESSTKVAEAKAHVKEEASSQFYIVKAGDNPWTIAMKHHMKVEDLLRLNRMDKEKAKRLKPGDKLRVR